MSVGLFVQVFVVLPHCCSCLDLGCFTSAVSKCMRVVSVLLNFKDNPIVLVHMSV